MTSLPPVLTVNQVAELLRVSRDTVYDAIRDGSAPFPVLHLGRAIRVPRDPLLQMLGINPERDEAGHASPATVDTATETPRHEEIESDDDRRTVA